MSKVRYRPNVVFTSLSPNQSSRNGARPRLIVVHSTESENRPGESDLRGVASWFANPAAQASSHVIVDADGNSARIVEDNRKAWTQAWFNPWSLSVEQVGRASQTQWARDELRETARWIARWSVLFDIPATKGVVDPVTGRVIKAGVVRHSDLGNRGGNHNDPGDGYPLASTLALSRFYRSKLRD